MGFGGGPPREYSAALVGTMMDQRARERPYANPEDLPPREYRPEPDDFSRKMILAGIVLIAIVVALLLL